MDDAVRDLVKEAVSTDVGLIGLGRMGCAIGARLVAQGHRLTVWNRSPEPMARLRQLGASTAALPADTGREGGVVITMLTDEAAVRAVCLDEGGLLQGLRGGTHLAMSTVSPEFAYEMNLAHEAAGVSYISAPVQGRPPLAAEGRLTAWISGPEMPAPAHAVLASLCGRIVPLGSDVRHACAAKLALNFLMFANVEIFAEAFSYLERLGVDRPLVARGLADSVFPGPLFQSITSALLSDDMQARGSDLRLSAKDLALLVHGQGVPADALPVAHAIEAVYLAAVAAGLGPLDATAVRRMVNGQAS